MHGPLNIKIMSVEEVGMLVSLTGEWELLQSDAFMM
jgi:hypothetical protein